MEKKLIKLKNAEINYSQNEIYSIIETNFKKHDYNFVSMVFMINTLEELMEEQSQENYYNYEKILLQDQTLFFKVFLIMCYSSKCLVNHFDFPFIKELTIYNYRINRLCDIKLNIQLFLENEKNHPLFHNEDLVYLISEIIYYYPEHLDKLIKFLKRMNDIQINFVLGYMFDNYAIINENENYLTFDRFMLYKSFFTIKYSPFYIDRLLLITDNESVKTLKSLENQILFVENLGYHHKEALFTYTRHGDEIINNYLRGVNKSIHNYLLEVDPFDNLSLYDEVKLYLLRYLEEIFQFIPKTNESIILYRKSMFNYPEKYNNQNYISTSINREYVNHMRGSVFEIHVKENSSVIPLMTLSHFDEGEVLINKNSELKCFNKTCFMFSQKSKKKSKKSKKKSKKSKKITNQKRSQRNQKKSQIKKK